MAPIRNYRDLRAWQCGMALAVHCYKLTRCFPKEELFGLTSQIRRAASSIPANVAEGHGRLHTKEYIRHLGIAHGSLAELETHLLLGMEIGLLKSDELNITLDQSAEIGRLLTGLRKALKKRL